jgi:hypothetical protein
MDITEMVDDGTARWEGDGLRSIRGKMVHLWI